MQMQRTASAEKRANHQGDWKDVVADAQGDMDQASAAFTQFDLKTCAQRHLASSMMQATGDEFETVKQGADATTHDIDGTAAFLDFSAGHTGKGDVQLRDQTISAWQIQSIIWQQYLQSVEGSSGGSVASSAFPLGWMLNVDGEVVGCRWRENVSFWTPEMQECSCLKNSRCTRSHQYEWCDKSCHNCITNLKPSSSSSRAKYSQILRAGCRNGRVLLLRPVISVNA